MKTPFIILAILCWPAIAVLDACCPNQPLECVYITRAELVAFDNAGVEPVETGAAPVDADALMLRLTLEDSISLDGCAAFRISDLAPSAHAFRCETPERRVDTVVVVRITSSAAIDSNHPAGTDLTELFYGINPNARLYAGTDDVYFRGRLADTGTHIFTVQAVTQRNDTLTAETRPVRLVP